MIYRRRATPLHGARAAVAAAWCAALAAAALVQSDPVMLGALAAAVLAAGALAGVWRQLRGALLLAVPVALAVTVINALVTRDGLTVIWRIGEVPLIGEVDVTLQATVYGAILGLRALVLVLCGTLYTVAVDPDEVLAGFRRISYRSALSATLATRLVPVLTRDARRLADARRCRPGAPPSRLALARATTSGVLDRALDVAAALETRGYGVRRPARRAAAPWTRQDIAFALSAVAIAGVAIGARVAGLTPLTAYPALRVGAGPAALVGAAALLLAALAPFAARRGMRR